MNVLPGAGRGTADQPAGRGQEPGQCQKLLFPKDPCTHLGSPFFPLRPVGPPTHHWKRHTPSFFSRARHRVPLRDKAAESNFVPLPAQRQRGAPPSVQPSGRKGQPDTSCTASQGDSFIAWHTLLPNYSFDILIISADCFIKGKSTSQREWLPGCSSPPV
ncbi:hypothetical protein HJG60_009393 [Phyllostomus discolor]|uniref:Uncharacterized protein n=1 Tax=Phyllostomus discolor TaxID=89673 RepID=A0A833YL86_9CHIR|nr:hypothetical protein HJG60_009393 [Phyllostomus discolor]